MNPTRCDGVLARCMNPIYGGDVRLVKFTTLGGAKHVGGMCDKCRDEAMMSGVILEMEVNGRPESNWRAA